MLLFDSVEDAFNALKQFRAYCEGVIIITLDKDGCVCVDKDNNKPFHVPAKTAHVVDDTAAGDIFRATLVSMLLEGKSLLESIELATRLASESTLLKGVDYTLRNLEYREILESKKA